MKSSSFSRTIELAKLAAQVGFKELRSGDLKSRYDQAVVIAKSLSQLKGAAMKAGQLLSLDLDEYFPPEAIEVLSQLQNAATAHPLSEIKSVLQKELPHCSKSFLDMLSATPLGVASIGQVHKGVLDGEAVAVKVQYPNVADSVDADLKILKTLASSYCTVTGRKMSLDPLFSEFRKILVQELDYQAEARMQREYRQRIQQLPPTEGLRFKVPSVKDSHTTKKVLTMSFEEGVTIRQWIQSNPRDSEKALVGKAVLDLYLYEFFAWGLVQTDPNWGNFLIASHTDTIQLCLLDFGATRTYDRSFIQDYIVLLNLAARNDFKALKEHAISFGLIDPRESEKAFVAFDEMLKVAIRPFFAKKNSASSLFDFSDRNHSLESQNTARALAEELVYSPPPYSLVFLNRKLAGVYSILKSLGLQMDVSPYWDMMNELAKEPKNLKSPL